MKKFVFSLIAFFACLPAMAVPADTQSRRSMNSQMVMTAPRATASTNQISAMAAANSGNANVESAVRVDIDAKPANTVDLREKEKAACINNNIGVGNTFVWASRYSNSNNYASMVEDTQNPEDNICFVKVELRSDDPKISVSDIPSQYFEMGRDITCGSWADEENLRQRILDAKKTARTWATVGGVVGGAGIGVGSMELFGNRLIGGSVEGQKNTNLSAEDRMRSQLLVLKQENKQEFDKFKQALQTLKTECEKNIWNGTEKPAECSQYNYEYLLGVN